MPDITHHEELVLAMHYASKTKVPIERFLNFFLIEEHEAEHLVNNEFNILEDLKISVHNCRGQSYDTTSNMTSKLRSQN